MDVKNLLFLVYKVRACGAVGREEREQILSHASAPGLAAFLDVLGPDALAWGAHCPVTESQADEIERRIREAYAFDLSMERMKRALTSDVERMLSWLDSRWRRFCSGR